MAVAQRRHGNAGGEVEKTPTIGVENVGALAPHKRHIGAGVGRHDRGDHVGTPDLSVKTRLSGRKAGEYGEGPAACQLR